MRFSWDAAIGRYVRFIDGVTAEAADGKPIATPNVIVQFCTVTAYPQDVDVNGNPSQYTHTIGTGHGVGLPQRHADRRHLVARRRPRPAPR